MAELIYHSIVRDVRKTHRNALVGLFMNMMQTIVFVLTFYAMFELMGMSGDTIRGDFLLYIMSGIFLFMCHTKAMSGAVIIVPTIAVAVLRFVHLPRGVCACGHRRSDWRDGDAAGHMVQRCCNRHRVPSAQAMGAGRGQGDDQHL
jgi:hypothetical protein